MKLETVYHVPSRTDSAGNVWYRCLSDMHFANATVGWAIGSSQILHTRDGGKTWIDEFNRNRACRFLNPHRVRAVTSKKCWITSISSSTDVRCCRTTDGGETWIGKKFDKEIYPNDVFFVDSRHGWLVADNGRLPAGQCEIYVSLDGGETWKAMPASISGKPHRICFSDPKRGWLVEHYVNGKQLRTYSRLYTSHDGGCSWRKISRFDRRILGLHIIHENCIFAVGEVGYIAMTKDGGAKWKRILSKSRANINRIRFYDDRLGIAAGDRSNLLVTTDGGQQWRNVKASENAGNFFSIHFQTNRTGVLASSNGLHLFELEP